MVPHSLVELVETIDDGVDNDVIARGSLPMQLSTSGYDCARRSSDDDVMGKPDIASYRQNETE